MQLTGVLLLAFCLQVSANTHAQQVSISRTNAPLNEIFNEIREQTGYHFIYMSETLQHARPVTIHVKNANLERVLQKTFADQPLSYLIDGKIIIVKKRPLLTRAHQPDTAIQISGVVTDSISGQPIPGVTILVRSGGPSATGTTTDLEGNFGLRVAPDAVLNVSLLGYMTKDVRVNGQQTFSIALAPSLTNLNEVVVIGYGSREKKDVTTSISTINEEDISKSTSMSPEYAMMGRMSGVQVSGTTGNPLSRPTVRIRGVNTWGISSPLYVIDGIPITEFGSGIEAVADARYNTLRGNVNVMTLINPNDIASISVLKDASAAAIYGVRAANGVVLITTKKGEKGQPVLEFNSNYGFQSIPQQYRVMPADELIRFKQQAYAGNIEYTNPATWDPRLNPESADYMGDLPSVDWQKPAINKNAPTQEYSARVSGGSEHTNYYLSAGYAATEGSILGTNMERYSAAANLNTDLGKLIRTGINYRVAYIEGSDNMVATLNTLKNNPSWQPIFDPNGYLGYASAVKVNANGLTASGPAWSQDNKSNYYGIQASEDQDYGLLRNIGSAFIEVEPLSGLTIRGTLSMDWYRRIGEVFDDYDGWLFDYNGTQHSSLSYGPSAVGILEIRNTQNFNLVKEFSVNYQKTFNDHSLNLLFNGSDQRYKFESVQTDSKAMTTKSKGQRYIANTEDRFTNTQTDVVRNALQGYLFRVGYNYQQKYYVDATVRRDGSSKFAPENRWGTFPSASVAWRMSAEPFLRELNWLTDLKLRAGWGELGNMEVPDMAWAFVMNPNPAYSWGIDPSRPGFGYYGAGAAILDLPNQNLTWEKTATTNIGFDAILFSSMNLSFEYYNKLTSGILQQTQLAPSVGSKNPPYANIARVKNSGFEMSLGWSKQAGAFNYSVNGNFTTVRNRVLETYEHKAFDGAGGRIEEGYPIGYVRGYRFGGLFTSVDAIEAYEPNDVAYRQPLQPGDAWFMDIHGAPDPAAGYPYYTPGADGIVNDYDQTYLYKTIPGYFYGLSLGAGWKNVDVSALFQGVGDSKGSFHVADGMGSVGNGTLIAAREAWTQENPESRIPRNVYGDPNSNFRFSSWYVYNRAYFRLQNLQIGYTLPASVYNALNNTLSHLRIYAGCTNLFTLTDWPGLNPDGADEMPRTFMLGLNARF